MTNQKQTSLKRNFLTQLQGTKNVMLMLFKICYCIKASNIVVMTFYRICHFAEQIWNVIVTLSPYLMPTYLNKHNLNIIKNINIIKKLVSFKNNITKIWPFYNVTSIHNSHVLIISVIQRNSDIIKKRDHLNK